MRLHLAQSSSVSRNTAQCLFAWGYLISEENNGVLTNPYTHRLLPPAEQLERLRLAAEATGPLAENIRFGTGVVVGGTPRQFSVHGPAVLAGASGGLIAGAILFVALFKWRPSRS